MAFLYEYKQQDFEYIIWKIDESADFFVRHLDLDIETQQGLRLKFRHQDSKLQWLASRYCLKLLFGRPISDFVKNEKGKLYLPDNSYQLSISHCSRYVSVVKSNVKVGIDIQQKTKKLETIGAKYIDSDSLYKLQQSEHYQDYLHVYWGIKESLFKAYGKGQLNFIKHLHIAPFEYTDKGTTTAFIQKDTFKINYNVFYEHKEDFYLCVVTETDRINTI